MHLGGGTTATAARRAAAAAGRASIRSDLAGMHGLLQRREASEVGDHGLAVLREEVLEGLEVLRLELSDLRVLRGLQRGEGELHVVEVRGSHAAHEGRRLDAVEACRWEHLLYRRLVRIVDAFRSGGGFCLSHSSSSLLSRPGGRGV